MVCFHLWQFGESVATLFISEVMDGQSFACSATVINRTVTAVTVLTVLESDGDVITTSEWWGARAVMVYVL